MNGMHGAGDRVARVVRGLAAASVATFVAAFSHVAAGGGEAPGVAGLAVSLAFSAMVCVLLTRRALSLPLLALAVALSQFAFHLLFGVGGGSGSGLVVSTHQHHGLSVSTLVADPSAVQSGLDSAGASGHGHDATAMWLAHALAAIVTVAALRHGELVLRRLLELGRVVADRRQRVVGFVRRVAAVAAASIVVGLGARAGLFVAPPHILERAAGLPVPDRLRDLGVVLGSLRHRGPPVVGALHLSV